MANEFPTQTSNPTAAGSTGTPGTAGTSGTSGSTGGIGSTGSGVSRSGGSFGAGSSGTTTGSAQPTMAKPLGADGTPDAAMAGAEHRTLDRAVKATHEAVDRAAGSVEQAADRLRASMSRLSEVEQEWAETARLRVREHPLASVAAALAVGMLLGRLSAPSRHDR